LPAVANPSDLRHIPNGTEAINNRAKHKPDINPRVPIRPIQSLCLLKYARSAELYDQIVHVFSNASFIDRILAGEGANYCLAIALAIDQPPRSGGRV